MSYITSNGSGGSGGSGVTSITGDAGGALTGALTLTGASTGLTFAGSGTTLSLGGDLAVGYGGTGNTTFTAYSVICAGTTATGAFQNVSGLGTSGQILTSQGAGSLPHWANAAASSISITGDSGGALTGNAFTFTASGIGLSFAGSGSTETLGGTLKLANGGTNADLTASNGGIFYSTASAGAILSGTATANQVLLSGSSTTPAWSTATYPATTTINQLLYSSSNNVIGGVTAGDYGVLISSSSGVPSWLANGTTGQVLTATTSGTPSWENAAASSITITGDSGGGLTGNSFTFTGGTTGLTFSGATTTETLGGTLNVANGGTGDTSFTAYAPICGGTTTTGVLQSASTGISTSGYVLTSNGSSSLPSFQAPAASGAMVLISTLTASNSASLSWTSGLTYSSYILVVKDALAVNASDSLFLRVSSNGGSSYISTGYSSDAMRVSTTWFDNNTSTGLFVSDFLQSSGATNGGSVTITGIGTSKYPGVSGNFTQGAASGGVVMGRYGTAITTNAIQLVCSTGNISSGTFSLYGINS